MILEDVKLNDTTENNLSSPYYFRSRSVRITTDKGVFETPNRVNTRTEYVARSNVPLAECLNLELAVDFRELDVEQTSQITTSPKCAEKLIDLTEQFNDITRRAIFKMSVFQPPQIKLDIMSNEEKVTFADFQADYLQLKLGAGIITYPYLQLPSTEYKKFIDARYRRTENTSTIFTLDVAMETNDLKDILDHLISKEQPMIICLIDRPWMETTTQHRIISSYYHNEKTAFFACQVQREELMSNSSNLHALAFASGYDLVALNQSRLGGGDKKLSLNKIKFFDPKTLAIDSIENVLLNPERTIVDEFDFSSHNQNDKDYVSMIIEGYEGAAYHPKKHQILYYLARVHEAMTSPRVFATTRDKIAKREVETYIKDTTLKNVPMITTTA